jgi:tetratricopeptide (TPR) repeat protein
VRAVLPAVLAPSGAAIQCSVESFVDCKQSTTRDTCCGSKDEDPRQTKLTGGEADRLLDDARQNTVAGHYGRALESIAAYHYGARTAVGHGGVRLSYAIDDWYAPGEKYPPAMAALLRARDEAADAVLQDTYCGDDFDAFGEVSAINRRLGERAKTAELFVKVAEVAPARARDLYLVAESELVCAGFYQQANAFLDPEGTLGLAIQAEAGLREFRKGKKADLELEQFERDYRIRQLATLAALLVKNGRKAEAEQFVAKAKEAFPSEDLAAAMDQALLAHFPSESLTTSRCTGNAETSPQAR